MHGLRQWHSHAVVLTFALCLCACRQPAKQANVSKQTPEALAKQVESLFIAGDLLAAQQAADSAYTQTLPQSPAWAVRFLVERARISLFRGETAEAATLLAPEPSPAAPVQSVLRRDLLLAIARGRLGDQVAATRLLTAAEDLHPQGALASELCAARGSVALGQGKLAEAETMFRAALDLASGENTTFQQTQMLMNLGVVALQQQHYEDALERFSRASTLAHSIGAKIALQFALGNLAWVYYETGDFLRARDTSRQAAAEAHAQGASLSEAENLKNAGMAAFHLNDLAAARSFYERSLALAEQLHSPDKLFGAHQALGYLLLQTDPTLAALHIHEATRLAADRNHRPDILEQNFAEGLLLARQDRPREAIALLAAFDSQPGALPSLYWEAESTLAKLNDGVGDARQAERWFLRALDTFRRQRLSLHSIELELPFLGNGNNLYFAYMDHLVRRGKPAEALDLLDRSRAETLAQGLQATLSKPGRPTPPLASPTSIAARLDATILIFCLRPGTSYVWSVTSTRIDFHRLPGSETILPLIRRHNHAILASDDLLTQKQSTGRALYDALIQPALPAPPPAGSRIVLIADEELNDLNFETLIPPSGLPHYWIEDVTVTNARSLRLLQASSTPRGPAEKNALLIGDPVYRGTEYPQLTNAATELSEIARHFAPSERVVMHGTQAVPAAYSASTPGAFAYIHFVAHATSNETSPLDSAIVLSRPTPQSLAYRLYAREILREPLHADLVTIAACYGSGRRNYSGEGLVGLAWAFLRAGAHNVIGALWEVSDASTPQLMDQLYTGLLNGLPPDAALRQAKLATLHAGGAFRKPLYWAPFQIYSGS